MAPKHQKSDGKLSAKSTETNGGSDQSSSFMGSNEEGANSRTVASRKLVQEKLGDDIEEYLARGGKISHIDPNVTADPPKRPVSHYGQRPL